MANLNLDQDVANKRERKIVNCSCIGQILQLRPAGMHRYGSLININPFEIDLPRSKIGNVCKNT